MPPPRLLPALAIVIATMLPAPAGAQRVDGLRAGASSNIATSSIDRSKVFQARNDSQSTTKTLSHLTDSLGTRKSYWLPGLIVGAALGLDFGIGLGNGFCESNCHSLSLENVAADASFAVAFGVIGGLIGSAIHRH